MRAAILKYPKLFVGIVMVALLTQSTTMLSPALAEIQKAFPAVSAVEVQSLITLPSLIALPVFLVSGLLSRRVCAKSIVLTGVAAVAAGGLLPVLSESFAQILWCRALAGAGLGLLSPFAQSLVSENYEGEDVTILFGVQAAAVSAGNMLGCWVSGTLAEIDYRAAFLCYAVALASFAAALFCLPRTSRHPAPPGSSALQDYTSVPPSMWLKYLFMAAFSILYFAYFNNVALMIEARGLGGSSASGMTTVISSLVGILAGVVMPRLHQTFGRHMLPLMLLLLLFGLLLESTAVTLWAMHISSFLVGFAYSVVMPYMLAVLSRSAPGLNQTVVTSLFMISTSLGAAVSAFVLEGAARLLGRSGPQGQLLAGMVLAAGLLLAVLTAKGVCQREMG